MARNVTPFIVLGGLVTVGLSLGAGFVGATLATGDADAPSAAPRVVAESTARARLDELDRRLANVEEQIRILDERSIRNAELRDELDALRRQLATRPGDAPTRPDPEVELADPAAADVEPSGDEVQPKTRAERLEERRAAYAKVLHENSSKLLVHRLRGIADATPEGATARGIQVEATTRQLAVRFGLNEEQRDVVREIFREEMESTVREVAPYLGGGLERADYGAIQDKLEGIWEHRIERLDEVLDDEQYATYTESEKTVRETYEKVLEELAARRGQPSGEER